MKTQQHQTLGALDHMIISAGGRTQHELEDQALRATGHASCRPVFRAIARGLAAAARWFEAKGNVLSEG